MNTTSLSLLDRLQGPADAEAWQRLVALYTPLIRRWLQRAPLQPSDVDDLSQEVLSVVVRKLPEFRHARRPGSFRAWLRTITVNCLHEFGRAGRSRPVATGDSDFLQALQELEDPDSSLSRLWDQEHDQHVVRRLLELLEPEFKPKTWQAFYRQLMSGEAAEAVAADLGMSVNAVVIAKSRVLHRLRQESQGLVDAPSGLF